MAKRSKKKKTKKKNKKKKQTATIEDRIFDMIGL